MTLDELLLICPVVLAELTAELYRRCDESHIADKTSQQTACLLVALRAASLLNGMAATLQRDTLDSYDTLSRAYIEARDLLITFRFDDKGARDRIAYWNAGQADSAWKADHTKCDEHLMRLGAQGLQLAENWSKLTALSHPTKYAADNSAVVVRSWVRNENEMALQHKRADYIGCLSRLIISVTYELRGWISLGCDPSRMPDVETFHQNAELVAAPILNSPPQQSASTWQLSSRKGFKELKSTGKLKL